MPDHQKDSFQDSKKSNANQVGLNENSQTSKLSPPPFQLKSTKTEAPIQGFGMEDLYAGGKGVLAGAGVGNIMSGLTMLSGSPVAQAIPFVNMLTGGIDAANSDNGVTDRLAGGARGIGGITGALGLTGLLPTVASLSGATATGAGATAAGGAFAGAGAAATSAGALLGAGAAGWGLGRGLDNLVGWGMDATGASDAIDGAQGISRPDGQHGDYSLSGMMSGGMQAVDETNTAAMRALGVFDDEAPAYTQTLGWKLAEVLPSWMQ